MGWQDRLRPAVYRGARFSVLADGLSVGRRTAVHEPDGANEPLVQDRGRRARRYTFQGFVLGDDYHEKRDALIKACESDPRPGTFATTGGGQLHHPTLGVFVALCEQCDMTEEVQAGRMATFRLTFVEVPHFSVQPTPHKDRKRAASAAATAAEDAAGDAVESEMTTAGPEVVRAGTASVSTSLSSRLAAAQAVFTGPAADVAAFSRKVVGLANQAAQLATSPLALVDSFKGAFAAIEAAAGNALGSLFAYEALFGSDSPSTGGSTPFELRGDDNAASATRLARSLAVAGAARVAATISWTSLTEAVEVRDRLLAEADGILDTTTDPDLCAALVGIRTAVTEAIPLNPETLPSLRKVTLGARVPATVLSYALYATADRAREIIERNRVPKPWGLPAGEPLEVLNA